MWNVEEIVKINKRLSKAGAGSGWGWGGESQRPPSISSRLQRPPPGHTGLPRQHSCGGHRVSQVLGQLTSSLPALLTYLRDNVYQALEPKDIASILALMYHTVLAIQPAGGVCKVDHAHIN